MDKTFLGHKIGAWRLALHYDGLYYAFVDDLIDYDIEPSRYPAVTIRRIKKAWGHRFIFEKQKEERQARLNNRYME